MQEAPPEIYNRQSWIGGSYIQVCASCLVPHLLDTRLLTYSSIQYFTHRHRHHRHGHHQAKSFASDQLPLYTGTQCIRGNRHSRDRIMAWRFSRIPLVISVVPIIAV